MPNSATRTTVKLLESAFPTSLNMLPTTLALIDDDQVYADGLAGYLRSEGIAVNTFADGRDFLAHLIPMASSSTSST